MADIDELFDCFDNNAKNESENVSEVLQNVKISAQSDSTENW